MINPQDILKTAIQILKFELENELRRSCATAISGYSPKFQIQRTGNLMRNIKARVEGNKIIITMPEYGKYIEYGTGIYGPHNTPIRPTQKKALAFNGFVFKEVDGRPATPFIRPVFHNKLQLLAENAVKKAVAIHTKNGNQ